MRLCVLLLAALPVAFAPAPLPRPGEDDLKRMQGAWVLVYSVRSGLREDQAQQAVWLIEGSRVSTTLDGKPGSTFFIALDGKKPRSLDILSSREGAHTVPGRYSVEGDTLKVSIGQTRPADLSGNGTSHDVWVFRRKAR